MKPARITKYDRAQMQKYADQGLNYKQIAEKLGCSPSTVGAHMRATGRGHNLAIPPPTVASNKQRRAEIATRLLDEAENLLDDLHRPYTAYAAGGKDFQFVEHEVAEPLPRDKADLIRAAVLSLDEHRKLTDFDAEDGAAAAKSVLGMFANVVGLAAERLESGQVVGELLQGTAEDA